MGVSDERMVEIGDALERLAELDGRRARVFEMRVFGGMSIEEVAGLLGCARSTVTEDFAVARAFLAAELGDERGGASAGGRGRA